MANHKQALKRHRQSLKRRVRNKTFRSGMKTIVKNLLLAIENKDKDVVQSCLKQATTSIAKTATKGVIHKRTAYRTISRLTKRANVVLQAAG